MSFVSVVPFGETLAHWWNELEGEPVRLKFMALKMFEVSTFLGNHLQHRQRTEPAESFSFEASKPNNNVSIAPSVVVVVPAYIRTEMDARRLRALLDALAVQSHPCRVVVVDDGSPSWVAPADVEVIALPKNSGPAAARNRGISRALELRAEVVALTDSDCVPTTTWIAELLHCFRSERRAHAVSGATSSLDRSFLGRYHERNGTLNGRRLHDSACLLYGPSCNLALTAELAASIAFDSSFPEAAAEDIELCFRANQAGWRICHAARALVRHEFGYDHGGVLSALWRFRAQFRRYARGERLLLMKHPEYFRAFAGSSAIPVNVSAGDESRAD